MDPFGRALVAASRDNDRVLVLGWSSKSKESLMPQVYGFVAVDGKIQSLSVSTDSAQSPLSVLVALAPKNKGLVDAAVTFELSADSIKSGEITPINNLLELDPKSISLGVAKLPNLNSIFMTDAISKRATCFASSSAQKTIRQIELEMGKSSNEVAAFSRSLTKVNSHSVTFAKPFHGLWIASACRSGQVLLSRNLNEKLAIPPTTGGEQFRLKFDKNGSSLIVYTSTALYNINLGLKPEMQQRVTEHTSKLSSAIKPIWKGSAAEYSKSLDSDDDTTWFERQTKIAMTEQNKKVSKTQPVGAYWYLEGPAGYKRHDSSVAVTFVELSY